MAIIVNENSYITIDEADVILEHAFNTDAWIASSDTDKEKALRAATRNTDNLSLQGVKYSEDQLLEFPRNLTRIYLNDAVGVVPARVKEAVAIEGAKILTDLNNSIEVLKLQGIKSQSIEGTSYTIDQNTMDATRKRTDTVSKDTKILLKGYIKTTFDRR